MEPTEKARFLTKPLVQGIAVLVILFLLLTVIDKTHLVIKSFSSTKPDNTISMSAEGKVTAAPDLATVTLGVLTTSSTAKQAQSDNTTKVNSLIDFVKKQGVAAADITTTDLSVNPQYDYTSPTQKVTGYQANQTIMVKLHGVDKSTTMLDNVIGGATDAGANQINGVSLTFENPDGLKQQARKMAIDKAKQQAQELADQAGIKLGKVTNIAENSSQVPYPIPYAMDSVGGKGGGPVVAPNVQTGSQDITESITLTFEVK